MTGAMDHLLFINFYFYTPGIGLGVAYLCSFAAIAHYFERRLPLANGIATSGTGVGMFIFGPLSQFLLDQYTWRGVMVACAAAVLQLCVVGSLVFPSPPERENAKSSGSLCDRSIMVESSYIIFTLSSSLAMLGKCIHY
jgi:MCP family monocarboxylic acid transporter-like MFS transporter 13/MCP family monocarboxylic acid transporter-like MFS transporter 12